MILTSGFRNGLGAVVAATLVTSAAFGETHLLGNVNVLPMDAPRVLESQDVLIRDGIIAALGEHGSLVVSDDTIVIDGDGAYLLPGLSDMHAHISVYSDADGQTENAGVAENQFLLYLATGVTLLRDPAGSPAHFGYRERIAAGEIPGPDLYFTSRLLEGENAVWDWAIKVLDPAEAEPLIAGFARDGYWGVKIYHTISAEVFDAVIEAGKRHDLPIIGHVPFEVGIERSLLAGMYSIEHLRGYDFDGLGLEALAADGGRSALRFSSMNHMSDERMDELVDLTVSAGAWNTPTLAISRFLFDAELRASVAEHPRFALVHTQMQEAQTNANALDAIFPPESKAALREVFPRQQELVRRLHEAGAGLLVGTDAVIPAYVPGFTPIDEMLAIAEGGVSTFAVLSSATRDAAASLGIESSRGTVAVGKQASLILVDGNPLEDLTVLWELEGVFHHGRWMTLADIERRLREQAAARDSLRRVP